MRSTSSGSLWLGVLLVSVALASCASQPPPGDLVKSAREGQGAAAIDALEAGADVDQQDAAGRTALIYSGRHCLERLALELIRSGASINHQAKDGRTALMEAASAGCVAVTELLLQNGALKDIEDKLGRDALAYATDGLAAPGPRQLNYQRIVDLLR